MIPRAVLDFEALAEDACDVALSGDLAGVKQAEASVSVHWNKLRKTVVHDGLKDLSARALDKAAEAALELVDAMEKDLHW